MSYPPPYTPLNSFADDEANQASGRSTVRTAEVDANLAGISDSINALIENARKIQRDDDKLRDFVVEPYALSEQLRAMLVAAGKVIRGEWQTFTNYAVGDLVQRTGIAYVCQTAHNSGPTFNLGFWLAISGDGQAAAYAEQALISATSATASAASASSSALTATAAASAAAVSQTAAAASALAAQNAADSIAGLAPVNLSPYMLSFLANNNAAGARTTLAVVGTADLISTASPSVGSGLVGFDGTKNYPALTIGWAERFNAVKPEWWIATGMSVAAALQAAIDFACTNQRSVQLTGRYTTATPLNLPTNASGCLIYGATRSSGITFTGASGSLFNAVSTRAFTLQNMTLVGPGSSIATTGVTCSPVSSAVGTFYNGFDGLTIEGFQTPFDISGLVGAEFNDIHIGLAKSGHFGGSDIDATPLVGFKIGTTVLACQFRGITVFARQRCVQQTTAAQLVEGHYWTNCTFDLSFNSGTNANQSCIYYESGQDINFLGCWFTNSAKYLAGTSAPYSDALVNIAYNAGGINAPLTKLSFVDCTFVGNGILANFGASPLLTNEATFSSCRGTLYVNVGNTGINGGFHWQGALNILVGKGNAFRVVGDTVNISGTNYYNLVGRVFELTGIKNVAFEILVGSDLPLNSVTSYGRITNVANGEIRCLAPDQLSLTAANDVVSNASPTVAIYALQQKAGRQFEQPIADGTYNNGTVVSYNTQLLKPRMATVEVYIDLAVVTNPGGTLMEFEIVGLNATDRYFRVLAVGNNVIKFSCKGLVSGTVSVTVTAGLQIVVGATAIRKVMTITYD